MRRLNHSVEQRSVLIGNSICLRALNSIANKIKLKLKFFCRSCGRTIRSLPVQLNNLIGIKLPLKEHLFIPCSRTHPEISVYLWTPGWVITRIGKFLDFRLKNRKNRISPVIVSSKLNRKYSWTDFHETMKWIAYPDMPLLLHPGSLFLSSCHTRTCPSGSGRF